MKRLLVLALAFLTLTLSITGCKKAIKVYDKTPIISLTHRVVNYNGGYTTEYHFDFKNNVAVMHSYLPASDEFDKTELLAEFSDEQEKILINRLYTYGLFNLKSEYKAPVGVIDGSGWDLTINYEDGTSKASKGSNNAPKSVFSDCAKAFYDICSRGVVASVPTEYHTPPNVSYALHTTTNGNTLSQGATSLTCRGNYKWNGFEVAGLDYFQINQNYPFPYELNGDTRQELVLYTANYGNYARFKKCIVTAYDYSEGEQNETLIVEKGWFNQIEFSLTPNKIYVIRLCFKNGDFVEYTLNTKLN